MLSAFLFEIAQGTAFSVGHTKKLHSPTKVPSPSS